MAGRGDVGFETEWNPRCAGMSCKAWIPAFAGMTVGITVWVEAAFAGAQLCLIVMPAEAGIQGVHIDSHLACRSSLRRRRDTTKPLKNRLAAMALDRAPDTG